MAHVSLCGICYRKLEDLPGADLLWVVVCYICFLGLRRDEVIGGTHSSSVKYFHQAPSPGQAQMRCRGQPDLDQGPVFTIPKQAPRL